MRRLDRRLGRPLCRLLTWARRAGLVRDEPEGAPERILVIKLAEQGATVAAVPALRRAVELVGRDRTYVAVFEQNRPMLDALDVVDADHVLAVPTGSASRTLRGLWRVARRARRLGIDTTVDLEFLARSSAVLAVLSGARRRAGLHAHAGEGPDRGDLMTHRVSPNPLQHASHTFLAVVQALQEPTGRLPALDAGPWPLEPPPRCTPSPADLDRARALVAEAVGAGDGPLVLLNPNAGDLVPLRRWPEDRYVALARDLLERHPGARVLVTGGPTETDAAARVVAAIGSPRAASVAGRTTIAELLALYELAAVLVTNDSGPAHYASTTSIDVVVLFGPEAPAVFAPIGDRIHVRWAGIACSPCVNVLNDRRSSCTDNLCMQRISVAEVAATVDAALARRA